MQLSTLPVAILRLIFDGEHSYLVLELWKCGDSQLCLNLANGGVVEMQLTNKSHADPVSRWPRLLKHLRLHTLSIGGPGTLGSYEMLRYELSYLYGGLKRLIIRNQCLATALCANIKVPAFHASHPHPPPYSVDSRGYLILRRFLPELEELSIDFCHISVPHPVIAGLPDSLLKLEVKLSQQKQPIEEDEENNDGDDDFRLPPRLRHLLLPDVTNYETCFLLSLLERLPPSLVELDGHFTFAAFKWLTDPKHRSRLPLLQRYPRIVLTSSLHEKESYDIVLSPGAHLLDSLDKLYIPCVPLAALSSLFPFPSSLASLTVNSIDWKSYSTTFKDSNRLFLPPTLTSLGLIDDDVFNAECFLLLPRNLEKFYLYPSCHRKCPQLLPAESKHHVQEKAVSYLKAADRSNWRRITELYESMADGSVEKVAMAKSISAIESGQHFGLPLTLTKLELGDVTCIEEGTKITVVPPPLVTILDIENSFSFQPFATTGYMPPFIQDLSFRARCRPDQSIALILWGSRNQLDAPSSLTSLHLSGSEINTFEWKYFPQTLLEFAHFYRGVFQGEKLRLLPHNLTRLRLWSTPYNDLWTEFLPRSLLHLDMDHTDILGRDFASLPRNLVSLEYRNLLKVTYAQIMDLPTSLTQLKSGKLLSYGCKHDYPARAVMAIRHSLAVNGFPKDFDMHGDPKMECTRLLTAESDHYGLDIHPQTSRSLLALDTK